MAIATGTEYDSFYALAFGMIYVSAFLIIPTLYYFHEAKIQKSRGDLNYLTILFKTLLVAIFCTALVNISYNFLEANGVPVSYFLQKFIEAADLQR